MKTQAKKTLIAKSLYRTGIKAVPALILPLWALASCMQAEKISLDTSGAQGLLLGSLSLEGGLFGGGSGGATGPFSKDGNPTVVATSPPNTATIAPCSGSPCRARIRIQFDESMDTSTVLPLLVEISNGGWTDSNIAPLTSSISWSGTKYQNDTVTFEINSVHLPEGSNIQFNILTGYLKDLDSVPNDLSAPYSWTATTSFQSGRLPLVDTGSTLCTDVSGNPISCAGTLQDGAISQPRNLTRNANGTVVDNVTGLVWSACPQGTTYVHSDPGGSCTGSATGMTWFAAQSVCSTRNTEALGGRTDWRLPTADELYTIIDLDYYPAIHPTLFPGTLSSTIYWTATTSAQSMGNAYYLNAQVGVLLRVFGKGSNHNALCVAGAGNRSTAGFRDNGDSTITDQRNGLRWTKCAMPATGGPCSSTASGLPWTLAYDRCEALILAGRSNWRLPSRNELQTIWKLAAPASETRFFPEFTPGDEPSVLTQQVWTTSLSRQPSGGQFTNVFIIDFIADSNGIGSTVSKSFAGTPYVYCVADE